MGPVVPGSEVVIGYQALDCLLSVIAGLEALSEFVHTIEPVHTDNDGKSNNKGKGQSVRRRLWGDHGLA